MLFYLITNDMLEIENTISLDVVVFTRPKKEARPKVTGVGRKRVIITTCITNYGGLTLNRRG